MAQHAPSVTPRRDRATFVLAEPAPPTPAPTRPVGPHDPAAASPAAAPPAARAETPPAAPPSAVAPALLPDAPWHRREPWLVPALAAFLPVGVAGWAPDAWRVPLVAVSVGLVLLAGGLLVRRGPTG